MVVVDVVVESVTVAGHVENMEREIVRCAISKWVCAVRAVATMIGINLYFSNLWILYECACEWHPKKKKKKKTNWANNHQARIWTTHECEVEPKKKIERQLEACRFRYLIWVAVHKCIRKIICIAAGSQQQLTAAIDTTHLARTECIISFLWLCALQSIITHAADGAAAAAPPTTTATTEKNANTNVWMLVCVVCCVCLKRIFDVEELVSFGCVYNGAMVIILALCCLTNK